MPKVKELYESVRKSFPGQDRPSLEIVCQSDDFAPLFDPDLNIALDADQMKEKLRKFVSEWIIAQQRELVEEIQRLAAMLPPILESEGALSCLPTSHAERLSLATSMFKCANISCISRGTQGPSVAVANGKIHHKCRDGNSSPLEFSSRGSSAVAFMLRLLGLDVHKATPTDLDSKNAHFVCLSCEGKNVREVVTGRRALKWRECVRSSWLLDIFDLTM